MASVEATEWTPSIVWDDEYSIGHAAVDDDHKRLFELYNRFSAAVRAGEGQPFIHDFLAELVNYTKYHFAREETLMARLGYPDLEHHRKSHQRFTAQLDTISADTEAGKPMDQFLLNLVLSWLCGHILILDKRIHEFMTAKSA